MSKHKNRQTGTAREFGEGAFSASAEAAVDAMLSEPLADEPTARLYGLWKVPGQGHASAVVELPQSLVERFATKVWEPEILSVALGRLLNEIEAGAVKG